jgi:hypothetical protein
VKSKFWLKNTFWNIMFQVILPIIIGLSIYAFWREINFIDPTHKVFPLFPASHIPPCIKYNLPDGLWLFALISALFFLWVGDNSRRPITFWIITVVFFSFLTEIFQAFKIIPGTFDWADIITYSFAILFSLIIQLMKKYKPKFLNYEN